MSRFTASNGRQLCHRFAAEFCKKPGGHHDAGRAVAALARGIPFKRLTRGSLVRFGWGRKQHRIQAALAQIRRQQLALGLAGLARQLLAVEDDRGLGRGGAIAPVQIDGVLFDPNQRYAALGRPARSFILYCVFLNWCSLIRGRNLSPCANRVAC